MFDSILNASVLYNDLLRKYIDLFVTRCVKSVRIWSFSWSVFSRIRTEYGETLRISTYSVRMRENTDHENSEYENFPCNVNIEYLHRIYTPEYK